MILSFILFFAAFFASAYNYMVNVAGYGVARYPYQQYAFPTAILRILAFFVGIVGLYERLSKK